MQDPEASSAPLGIKPVVPKREYNRAFLDRNDRAPKRGVWNPQVNRGGGGGGGGRGWRTRRL